MIAINIDERLLNQTLLGLKEVEKYAPRAISNALNRSITHMREVAVREVVSQYFIKKASLRNLIKITESKQTTLNATIAIEPSPIPLINFDLSSRRLATKQTGKKRKLKPLSVSVMKNGAKKVIRGAFVQKTKSGYMGVFRRSTDARYPLAQLYGPSVLQMAQNLLVSDKVKEEGHSYFFKRLDQEIVRINAGIGVRR